jgi:hypothetical protein
MMLKCRGLVALVMLGTAAAPLAAQTPPPQNTWSHGTTIEAMAGIATASSRSGVLLGGGVGWEVTPWFGFEGNLGWLDRPRGAEAFSADLTAQVGLLPASTLVPYVKAGIGFYRASFDSAFDDMPEFYRRRLGPGGFGPRVTRTFTDPSFVIGGGLRAFVVRQWSVEPEIAATIVRRASRSHVVTAFALHFAYHFEDHPITPSQRQEASR